ncbi:MAG: N-acyl homoserine lactonase family protein [Aquisalimonadaceae bacterium]
MNHSVWTLCFAKGRLPGDFVAGAPIMSNQGTFQIPMIYSLIRPESGDSNELILVDTGFGGGRSMTGRNFDDFETPETVLAKVGVHPRDITLVILTHLHFDHAGNMEAFPNARFVVQRREAELWRPVVESFAGKEVDKGNWKLSSISPRDFEVLARIEAEGRLTYLDGDAEVAPGIRCRLAADTHTFGSQWIVIETADGPYILAGDCAYWYHNIERMWPPGYIQGNPWRMLETYEEMLSVVDGDLGRVVVGHDMEIFSRHRSEVIGANPVAFVHAE